jgi:hypothetical protein
MPGKGVSHAPVFRERLYVPLRWWVIATGGVGIGGAEVFAGFDWHLVVIVYLALALPTAAILLATGHLTVTVDAAGLHERGRTLPFEQIIEVQQLDREKTRRLLGPGGDRTAHLVARGYVPESVAIRTTDDSGVPYWLVSSRRPADLVGALIAARAHPADPRTPTSPSTRPTGPGQPPSPQ